MAAYAALLSLNFTFDQHHQRYVVYPAEYQYPIEYVKETIADLLDVFEDYDYQQSISEDYDYQQSINEDIVELKRDIAEAAYDVDYVIECLALDPVLEKSGYKQGKHSSNLFSEHEMVQIMQNFMHLWGKAKEIMVGFDEKVVTSQGQLFSSSRSFVRLGMVGFQDMFMILDAMIKGESNLEILPIVGMGGIGKTTLTKNIYDSEFIKDHFDIRMWCTISQTPDLQIVLQNFLQDLGIVGHGQINRGIELHKHLLGRRYLIVLDDIWGVDVWDTIKSFFPDNGNGSRIIITTRLLSVASYIGTCEPYQVRFLDDKASWNLLNQKVFAGDICPPELEQIGKHITESCRGLPLVIVVVAGHLSNNMTRDSWERVALHLGSMPDSRDEDWCLQILSYCYENLRIHLKPCFLYMGVFPEDHSIQVSLLIKMWVSEGFLKPIGDQCLEDVAMEYLMDLIQRNLILVTERSSTGKIKYIQIHDFLRDLCLMKAHEYNFLRSRTDLKLGILPGAEKDYPLYLLPRRERFIGASPLELASKCDFSVNKNLMHFHLRGIRMSAAQVMDVSICSASLASISMFQNLHSLIMKSTPGYEPVFLPPHIWEMPLLKHVEIERVVLPNPPGAESYVDGREPYVLMNMLTLLNVYNFKFSDEVVDMIPNLKKIKISYTEESENVEMSSYCLNNLAQLYKLESLSCCVKGKISIEHIDFPQRLRSLTLIGGVIPWKDMYKVGWLGKLEKLSLWDDAFCGSKWTVYEGQFYELKVLKLGCSTLEHWETESSHFPALERLTCFDMQRLKEIPKEFGKIMTLQLVSVERCCTSLVKSAYKVKEEQQQNRNVYFRLHCDRAQPEDEEDPDDNDDSE